jgi:hypothetical protein
MARRQRRVAHIWEGAMKTFIRNQGAERYRKLIAIAEGDPSRDEARYQALLRLLADEVATALNRKIARLIVAAQSSGRERFEGNAR